MTQDQFHTKLIAEMKDLNSSLKTLSTELTRIEKILFNSNPPPVTLKVSMKEDENNGD